MRLAWDLQAVTGPNPTGLGHSVRLLLAAARAHLPQVQILGLRPNLRDAPLRGVPDRLGWEQWRLPRQVAAAARTDGIELLYSPALGAPLSCAIPVVAHIHDLIALRFREQFSGAAGWYWKQLLPAGWRKCRRITVSNLSLVDEVVELLLYPRERISVVPYYADPQLREIAAALSSEPGTPMGPPAQPLYLALASHEPRKNLALCIQALALVSRELPTARLVLAGGASQHTEELLALAARLGVAPQLDCPGYVGREQLVRLMLGATALLFPSRYEGYGMPPQEAQSVGCPVVLSGIACHRAVYADPLLLERLDPAVRLAPPFVDPDDADGLAEQMLRLARDGEYWSALRNAGQAYQALLTARDTAQALLAAWQAALL